MDNLLWIGGIFFLEENEKEKEKEERKISSK